MDSSCRICLKSDKNELYSVEMDVDGRSIAALINFASGIEVSPLDNLPQKICVDCMYKIRSACKIKETCITSDRILRSSIKLEIEELPEVKQELLSVHSESVSATTPMEAFDVESQVQEYFMLKSNFVSRKASMKKSKKTETAKTDSSDDLREIAHESPSLPTFKCHLCHEIFYKVQLKKEHIKAMHAGERKCSICNYKAVNSAGLEKHIMFHQKPELLSFMCHCCSKKFHLQCLLMKHIKDRHSETPVQKVLRFCDLCGHKTVSKNNLAKHLRTVHLYIRAYPCPECEIRYSTRLALEHHQMNKHGMDSDFKCQHCEMKFSAMSFLRAHLKTHFLKRTYCKRNRVYRELTYYMEKVPDSTSIGCKVCNETFDNKAMCSKHFSQKHKNNLVCPECPGMRFNSSSNMLKHIDIRHKKIHPFSCSYCSKTFGQKNQLDSHVNTHTGAKPFSCKFCTFRTGDGGSLSKHKKKCSNNPANFD